MHNQKRNNFRLILSLYRLRGRLNELSQKYKKRVLVFLVFLVISSLFWFYRALNESYATDISFPVKFSNLPNNKILTSTPPKKVKLLVRGEGYSILSKKLQFNRPFLTFDVNDFSLHNQSIDSLSVYFLTNSVLESVSRQLISENDQLEILRIQPDTIYLSFSKMYRKSIPIVPNFTNKDQLFARQYTLNGNIKLTPDSVIIMGPSQIIDSVTSIHTSPLNFVDLKDSVYSKIDLVGIKGATLSTKKSNILIPVDKYTESSYLLPIQVKHLSDSLTLKVFPESVRVNYQVTFSHYKEISESDFMPYVNFNEVYDTAIPQRKLKVYLDNYPSNTFNITLYPPSVEFLIEANHVESRTNRRNR